MRTVKLYNALLWLVNAGLGAAIALVFFKYLIQQPDYTRDVRIDEGGDTASQQPARALSDASLRIGNPVKPQQPGGKGPEAMHFRAKLKGTLPGEKGDGPGAAFLQSQKNAEMVAFVGEKIFYEGKEYDEYRGWTLTKVWKDRALFSGPNNLSQELVIEAEAIAGSSGGPTSRAGGGARGGRAGQPYQADQFKSRLLASADSRQVWGLDPQEIEWASQNADRIMDGDFQVSPNAGGGVRVEGVTPGSIGASRGMMAGDIIRDVNGQPLNSIADVRTLMNNPAFRNQNGLRITIERAGKPVVLEYRPLPR